MRDLEDLKEGAVQYHFLMRKARLWCKKRTCGTYGDVHKAVTKDI